MANPDHSSEIKRINRIIGQLQGVGRMVESSEYCPKILLQTKAISSALRSLETNILKKHIHHCMKNALKKDGNESALKIKELVDIFKTRLK